MPPPPALPLEDAEGIVAAAVQHAEHAPLEPLPPPPPSGIEKCLEGSNDVLVAVFSKPAAEAEAVQSEDRLLALSSTATPVPGRGQWPLSPDVVYAALNEKDPETLRRKHTFSSLLKAYEKKSESFQKAQVFPDEVQYPRHCVVGLCERTTPEYVLAMRKNLALSMERLVKTFARPLDASLRSLLLACEADQKYGEPCVLFVEMLAALGRSGKTEPEQVFATYELVRGKAEPPYAGVVLGLQRMDFVAPECRWPAPLHAASAGSCKLLTADELASELLTCHFDFTEAVRVRSLRFSMIFEQGFDRLIVHGFDETLGRSFEVVQGPGPGPKKKKKKPDDEPGGLDCPDFVGFWENDGGGHGQPPQPPPPTGTSGSGSVRGDYQIFLSDLEAIVFGETPAKFPEEEVEDFAAAADAVEEEAQNVSEMQDDNEEASDPPAPVLDHPEGPACAPAGPAEPPEPEPGAEAVEAEAEVEALPRLLAELGFEERSNWRLFNLPGGDWAGKVNWMGGTQTLSMVCKNKAHGPECKMMLRLQRGPSRYKRIDLIMAAYRWLARGRGVSKQVHFNDAVEVKRSFGMRPRVVAAA